MYTELEYIESTGTQYISTGVGANATSIRYEAKFYYPVTSSDGFLWSSYNNGYGIGDLYNDSASHKFSYYYGSNSSASVSSPAYSTDTIYTIDSVQTLSSITTTLNGTTTTITRNVSAKNSDITLFRRGNTTSYPAKARLYYLKIYIDDVLVRDFIPAKQNNDIGLWDNVSSTFFYNSGTGDFIAGAEITKTGMYVGVSDTARKIANAYVGINGVARSIYAGYVGVNGIAEQIYFNDENRQVVNYTMLYDEGDECNDLTGGWENTRTVGGGTYTENADNITLYVKGSTWLICGGTANTIDTTDYVLAGIHWNYSKDSRTLGANRFGCGTQKTAYMETAGTNGCLAIWTNQDLSPLSGEGIYTFSLENINNNAYFQMNAQTNNANYSTTNIMYHCFLAKKDDWATLATKAGITATSISDILTNSATLLSNLSAVNFMVKKCTGNFMIQALQNSTFLNALNSSSYKSIVTGNEHWNKFLNMVS